VSCGAKIPARSSPTCTSRRTAPLDLHNRSLAAINWIAEGRGRAVLGCWAATQPKAAGGGAGASYSGGELYRTAWHRPKLRPRVGLIVD